MTQRDIDLALELVREHLPDLGIPRRLCTRRLSPAAFRRQLTRAAAAGFIKRLDLAVDTSVYGGDVARQQATVASETRIAADLQRKLEAALG